MKLYFDVSENFIKSELMKGIEVKKNQCIDIDFNALSVKERETLLRHCELRNYKDSQYLIAGYFRKTGIPTPKYSRSNVQEYSNGSFNYATLDGNTISGIMESFANIEKRRDELVAEEKKEVEQEIADFINKKDGCMRLFGTGIYSDFSGEFKDLKYYYENRVRDYGTLSYSFEQINAKAEEYKLLQSNKRQQEQKERDENEALNKKLEEKNILQKQALKNWALTNGSNLLKARIEEEMNWVELANEEYFNSICPEGYSVYEFNDYDDCWVYKNPTIEHIEALREAKKIEVFENVELCKCRIESEYGKCFYYLILARIRSFNKQWAITVCKQIESETIDRDED